MWRHSQLSSIAGSFLGISSWLNPHLLPYLWINSYLLKSFSRKITKFGASIPKFPAFHLPQNQALPNWCSLHFIRSLWLLYIDFSKLAVASPWTFSPVSCTFLRWHCVPASLHVAYASLAARGGWSPAGPGVGCWRKPCRWRWNDLKIQLVTRFVLMQVIQVIQVAKVFTHRPIISVDSWAIWTIMIFEMRKMLSIPTGKNWRTPRVSFRHGSGHWGLLFCIGKLFRNSFGDCPIGKKLCGEAETENHGSVGASHHRCPHSSGGLPGQPAESHCRSDLRQLQHSPSGFGGWFAAKGGDKRWVLMPIMQIPEVQLVDVPPEAFCGVECLPQLLGYTNFRSTLCGLEGVAAAVGRSTHAGAVEKGTAPLLPAVVAQQAKGERIKSDDFADAREEDEFLECEDVAVQSWSRWLRDKWRGPPNSELGEELPEGVSESDRAILLEDGAGNGLVGRGGRPAREKLEVSLMLPKVTLLAMDSSLQFSAGFMLQLDIVELDDWNFHARELLEFGVLELSKSADQLSVVRFEGADVPATLTITRREAKGEHFGGRGLDFPQWFSDTLEVLVPH